jgi:hypothetical protein
MALKDPDAPEKYRGQVESLRMQADAECTFFRVVEHAPEQQQRAREESGVGRTEQARYVVGLK